MFGQFESTTLLGLSVGDVFIAVIVVEGTRVENVNSLVSAAAVILV